MANKARKKSIGKQLKRDGFDTSKYNAVDHNWRVGCSQCNADVINGIACHEQGCPNQKKSK